MTKPTTRKQVLSQIKKMGCTVDEIGSDSNFLVIDSPIGQKFACTGAHCLVQQLKDEFNLILTRSDAYNAVIRDLDCGFIPCEDPECDHCHPE